MRSRRLIERLGAGALALALVACHGRGGGTQPVATAAPAGPQLSDAYLTDDRDNDVAKSSFAGNNEPIFFVFAATNVQHVPIRAVWFSDADNGGSQSALAEEEVTAAGQDYNGAFSHRPPPAGWKAGAYHVDVYFGTQLAHTEHFTIAPVVSQLASGVPQVPTGTSGPTMQPEGVPSPNVTPIPTPTLPGPPAGGPPPPGGFARDAMGNPIVTLSDRFQLHTSADCHDVEFMVELNDAQVGVYANPDMTADITRNFNPGINTLRVSWDAPTPYRNCRIAIALKRGGKYRTLTQIKVSHNTPAQGAYVVQAHVQ